MNSASSPPALRTTSNQGWYWCAVALVFAVYAAVCLAGIDSVWQWGHNGFNGASYAQAARNSLRFDMLGQAKYHTGLEAPPVTEIFTHHPMMIHLHLMAVFSVVGYSELAGRAVPALYSFASLALLFVFCLRYYGRHTALLAAVVWVLTPINLIYANMIDHEQGSIFWTIALLYSYCRWHESHRARWLVGVLLAVSMSVQFAWPGYYVALFIVLHAFVRGLRQGGSVFRWRPAYTFCGLFSVVVLSNFALFYAFIVRTRGGFDEMMEAFGTRSELVEGYAERLLVQTWDLQGIAPALLLLLWLPYQVLRERRRESSLGDLLPIFFLFAQVVNSTLFSQAGYIHAYWTYHASPAIAVGGALVLGASWRRFARWRPAAARPALAALVAATVLLPQALFAADRFAWGFREGHGAYHDPYDDQYLEAQWLLDVTRRFNRTNSDFILAPNNGLRIERLAYLDAPYIVGTMSRPTEAMRASGRRQVFLFDLHRVASTRRIERMVRRYPSWMYDRRFLVIDATEEGTAAFHALVHEESPASVVWRWLHTPSRGPYRWVPDPTPERSRQLVDNQVQVGSAEDAQGGSGGHPMAWDCPPGQLLGGFEIVSDESSPVYVAGVRPRCRTLHRDDEGFRVVSPPEWDAPAPAIGDLTGAIHEAHECADGSVVVGIRGHWAQVVDALGAICARPQLVDDPGAPDGYALDLVDVTHLPIFGGTEGEPFEQLCRNGSMAWGVRAREGNIVDAIGLRCARIDERFFAPPTPSEADTPEGELPRLLPAAPVRTHEWPARTPVHVLDASDRIEPLVP